LYALDFNTIEALKVIGGLKFADKVNQLLAPGVKDFLSEFFPTVGKVVRKLTYFPDREDKVRVVAILDYFSQSVLKPLHNFLYRVLKKIPQDCTFDQGSFKNKLKTEDLYISVDLSSATDRFPIIAINELLKGVLPEGYVEA